MDAFHCMREYASQPDKVKVQGDTICFDSGEEFDVSEEVLKVNGHSITVLPLWLLVAFRSNAIYRQKCLEHKIAAVPVSERKGLTAMIESVRSSRHSFCSPPLLLIFCCSVFLYDREKFRPMSIFPANEKPKKQTTSPNDERSIYPAKLLRPRRSLGACLIAI